MRVSEAGRRLIEQFEGCRLTTYRDVVGVLTIGYGCTGAEAWPGRTITQAEADAMLSTRLNMEFEPGVLAAIGDAPTTQAQFDAMVSLAFNIGIGAFHNSSVCRHHRDGDYMAAADSFQKWNMAGGRELEALTKRRLAEEKMYLSDLPSASRPWATPAATPAAYSRNQCARDMQTALSKLGLYTDKIDGDWGRRSRTAYNQFNQD